MVYVVNGVHVRGVNIILEKDFVHFAILKLEIHSFMIQIRILSMILQTFSPTLNNPSTNHTPSEYSRSNQQKMNDEFKIELRNELLNTMQSLCEKILQREQAANVSTHTPEPSRRFNIIYDYDDDDDDDEESTIPLNEITS
ncbi:hypothetical protein Tco_1470259 [Tanacetum coccineum]